VVDSSLYADFSKIGYDSYQYYPGAYSIPKIIEEEKEDQPEEKSNT
jgi:hypothetical protein